MSRRSRSALDVAVVLWVGAWIWMGAAVAQDLRGLSHLSDTVSSVGRAAVDTADTLRELEQLPIVGEDLSRSAASIEEAGRRAIESGQESRSSVNRTSILLALSIALIPSSTALLIYLPGRLGALRTVPGPPAAGDERPPTRRQ